MPTGVCSWCLRKFEIVPRPKWRNRNAASVGTKTSFELDVVKCARTENQLAILAPSAEIRRVFGSGNSRVGEGVLGPTNNISVTSAEIVFLKVTRNVLLCSVRRHVDVQDSMLLADLLAACCWQTCFNASVAYPFLTRFVAPAARFALMGHYAVRSGYFSVRNYHYSLRNNPEERSSPTLPCIVREVAV
jgi:hypothetical protein